MTNALCIGYKSTFLLPDTLLVKYLWRVFHTQCLCIGCEDPPVMWFL